ncbi:MAG: 16S rRNA (cytidine(1402)-2'-O)-methyltransferase [Chloroflexi bacterium]|nr:16S rRNA (cytidine(1402)-2'-O)-methyltransferase [Chloroflexota bacterium]
MPTLYLVATPIGNLEDITLRAIRVLGEVKLIAAEDTRRTRILLARYDIKTQLTSYYERNKRSKIPYLLQRLQEYDVALVSEAGMPGVNDPGYELVAACAEHGVPVAPIPGPSAPVAALAVSGLPTDQFLYLGFPPRQPGPRRRLLQSVAAYPFTLVFLEAPHRLLASLADMEQCLGDRKVAVCRELTKLHEEVFRGTLSQARSHFQQPKGEFTLVVAGREEQPAEMTRGVENRLRQLKAEGLSAKDAVAEVAKQTGLKKKELYREWLKLK